MPAAAKAIILSIAAGYLIFSSAATDLHKSNLSQLFTADFKLDSVDTKQCTQLFLGMEENVCGYNSSFVGKMGPFFCNNPSECDYKPAQANSEIENLLGAVNILKVLGVEDACVEFITELICEVRCFFLDFSNQCSSARNGPHFLDIFLKLQRV